MTLLTKILGLALAVAATFAACGAAATLALGSKQLSAGNAPVASCTGALSATRTVDNGGDVTRVDVGGIPAACSGETLNITLADASGAALGSSSGTVPAGGGSMTFTGFGTVSAASVTSFQYALAGA
jgi:FlaG/FlaF family flagellin (archaellin)